jgi:hypothetical protein
MLRLIMEVANGSEIQNSNMFSVFCINMCGRVVQSYEAKSL